MSLRRESDFARFEQRLREAEERGEQERRRAEEEQRNRQEADEQAEQERPEPIQLYICSRIIMQAYAPEGF